MLSFPDISEYFRHHTSYDRRTYNSYALAGMVGSKWHLKKVGSSLAPATLQCPGKTCSRYHLSIQSGPNIATLKMSTRLARFAQDLSNGVGEGSLEAKVPTIWTNGKHSQEEPEPGRNSNVEKVRRRR